MADAKHKKIKKYSSDERYMTKATKRPKAITTFKIKEKLRYYSVSRPRTTTKTALPSYATSNPIFKQQYIDILYRSAPNLSQKAYDDFIYGFEIMDYYTRNINSTQSQQLGFLMSGVFTDAYRTKTSKFCSELVRNLTIGISSIIPNAAPKEIQKIITIMEFTAKNIISYLKECQLVEFFSQVGQLFFTFKLNRELMESTTTTRITTTPLPCRTADPQVKKQFIITLNQVAPNLTNDAKTAFINSFELFFYYTRNINSTQNTELAILMSEIFSDSYKNNVTEFSSELVKCLSKKISYILPNVASRDIHGIINVMERTVQNCILYLQESQLTEFFGQVGRLFIDYRLSKESTTKAPVTPTTCAFST